MARPFRVVSRCNAIRTISAGDKVIHAVGYDLLQGQGKTMSEGFRLSLAIPLHNEESVLPELLRRTLAMLDSLPGGPHELLLVDDGSTDRSVAVVEEAAER
jgi:cellulose synthase/poly-beta-1,6-N-acetylglucosamine synthase-like glycosyltransferase